MPVKKDDWRLKGQEKYLINAQLRWSKYKAPRKDWDHDHCEFCNIKFMEGAGDDILTEGYTTSDNYRWICKPCYEDFKEMFKFEVT